MSAFEYELVRSLRTAPRKVSPKWFYDYRGSVLFDQICQQPEYYPTRTELSILKRHAGDVARIVGPSVDMLEFGAGATQKVQQLLPALVDPARYLAVDISGDHLRESVANLSSVDACFSASGMSLGVVEGDFTKSLELPPKVGAGTRLGLFFGSSIGNWEPDEATAVLAQMRGHLLRGHLLIGFDLRKDAARLNAAYNDANGVTAEFNLNLLARANREARADFDLAAWGHKAFYDQQLSRVEMHLVSLRDQSVSVGGERFSFFAGETIHTENSYKYSLESFLDVARPAGWELREVWQDDETSFAVALLRSRLELKAQSQRTEGDFRARRRVEWVFGIEAAGEVTPSA